MLFSGIVYIKGYPNMELGSEGERYLSLFSSSQSSTIWGSIMVCLYTQIYPADLLARLTHSFRLAQVSLNGLQNTHKKAYHPQRSHTWKWLLEESLHWAISSCTSDINHYWNLSRLHPGHALQCDSYCSCKPDHCQESSNTSALTDANHSFGMSKHHSAT